MIDDMLADYQKQLNRLIKKTPDIVQDASPVTDVKRVMRELSEKWQRRFNERSRTIADLFITQVDNFSEKNLASSLKEMSGGLTITPPKMPASLKARIAASTAENVALIRNIPEKYQQRIQGILMRSIQQGGSGASQFYNEFYNLGLTTRNRAKLIATDQTRKITAATNSERMKAVGVKQFEWIRSGGGAEPRELHLSYNGEVFDLDDPPVIERNKNGEVRGLPGQLINCRCKMRPIVDFTQYLENDETQRR